jgi:colicin import membrane protein
MALKTDPGFLASGTLHGVALVFLIVNFASPPKVEEPTESVVVDMITSSELNQITKGEKTAKPLPTPQRRVDRVAAIEDPKPAPPLAEAKKDVPLPPSPDKPQDDPGESDKPVPTPPQRVAALPPPTPVPAPEPTPPQRPVEKVETPVPPAKPAPEPPKAVEAKPPPPDAEEVEPKPPTRPKVEPKKEAKTEPAPVPTPKPPEKKPPVKEAKAPEPPKKPESHFNPNELAKLLKDDKPASKPKAGNEAKDAPRPAAFDPHSISALLDHEAPQRKAATGQKLTQVASLGLPNAAAATLSPSMMAQLDQIMTDQYRGCWSYFGLGASQGYVPIIRVHLAQDGSLADPPTLINPPTDPNLRSLADSAVRAAQKCNPMKIPARFAPYYADWAKRRVNFDPKDLM